MAIRPPVPPIFATFSNAPAAAESTDLPPYCTDAEMSCATTDRMKYSPSPVHETAQVSLLAYVPAPIIGESPILPNLLFEVPPVEVPAPRLPARSSATAPTVPNL